MVNPPAGGDRIFSGRIAAWGEPVLVLLAAAGLIALATWPWVVHLNTSLCTHWDTGLHAWKLYWNARHILDGGWLLPDYHANVFYPQAYTLALDDLFWVPSYFAALVLGLSHNPILTYNLTFLFFWSLNAMAMFLLLRELEAGRAAAWLGAMFFGVSPYLVSYYLEFNGTLCFGIPLVMWLVVRFFKKPTWLRALCLVLAYWAQAVSALYYTAILALSLPLVIAPLLRERSQLLRSPRFWVLGSACLVVLNAMTWLYLEPYRLLHNHMGLGRDLSEMALHSAGAFAYLRNASAFVNCTGLPWPGQHLPVTSSEMVLWPGLAVCCLAMVYWWRSRLVLRAAGSVPSVAQIWLHWSRIIALAVFWGWMIAALLSAIRYLEGDLSNLALNLAILVILVSSLLISLWPGEGGMRGRMVAGLATAAFLCFFLSLGPRINVGNHQALAANWMVQFLADMEVLHITRVLSRYGIVVIFALSLVAALAFDRLPLKPRWRHALLAAALLLVALEANIPLSQPYVDPPHYPDPKLEAFLHQHEPCTLAVLPLGDRELDSRYMLQVAGASPRRFIINGWTGFRYDYGIRLGRLFSRGDWLLGCQDLARLWPAPFIVVDRASLHRYVTQRAYRTSEQTLRKQFPLVYEDEFYAVFRPRVVLPASPRYERWVRLDILERTQYVHFLAHSPGALHPVPALLYVNDGIKAHLRLEAVWRSFDIKLTDPALSIPYNAIALVSSSSPPAPVEVKDFHLVLR